MAVLFCNLVKSDANVQVYCTEACTLDKSGLQGTITTRPCITGHLVGECRDITIIYSSMDIESKKSKLIKGTFYVKIKFSQ